MARCIASLVVGLSLLAGCDGDVRFDTGRNPSCAQDGDCRLASLHCDPSTRKCVPCLVDAHCAGDLPRCDVPSRQCVECNGAGDCEPDRTCDPTAHRCLKTCGETGSCPGEAPFCDASRGACVCTGTSCGEETCSASGLCVQCNTDAQCSAETPRCSGATGKCVHCLWSSDCPPQAPFCDPRAGECVAR